jgi:hypothetical protein
LRLLKLSVYLRGSIPQPLATEWLRNNFINAIKK